MQFSQKEADVIVELVLLYKNLYQLTADDLAKEQIMLTVLQKYHAAAENLSDSVKKSGDLKVWITLDPNPENEQEVYILWILLSFGSLILCLSCTGKTTDQCNANAQQDSV